MRAVVRGKVGSIMWQSKHTENNWGKQSTLGEQHIQRRSKERAGCLNKWTHTKPWREGTQVIKELNKDVCPMQRVEKEN